MPLVESTRQLVLVVAAVVAGAARAARLERVLVAMAVYVEAAAAAAGISSVQRVRVVVVASSLCGCQHFRKTDMKKLIALFLLLSTPAFAADPVQLPLGCKLKCEGWLFSYPPTPDKNGKTDPKGEHQIFIPDNNKDSAALKADAWATANIYKTGNGQ